MTSFVHEALLYDGADELAQRAVPFIRDAAEADEPVLVMVPPSSGDVLREALGADADGVRFADMTEVGRNPARIIPAWRSFVAEHGGPGRPMRGIGEPVYAARSAEEVLECQLHEALLNLAFADADGFQLLCPYDVGRLKPEVVHEAWRCHPGVREDGGPCASRLFLAGEAGLDPFDAPLPPPTGPPRSMSFDRHALRDARRLIADQASTAGLDEDRTRKVVLAVSELASNSVRHGGGLGVLRTWHDDTWLVCEVRDRGRVADPLAGRHEPRGLDAGGRGLWIANQCCDLLQLRSDGSGTVVRALMRRG